MNEVMRFNKRGKVSPQYISPFEVLKEVGMVSYILDQPPRLSGIHLIFHISMLKRCLGNGNYIIKWDSVRLDKDLAYEEEPVVILDQNVQKFRMEKIHFNKVQ